LKTKIATYKKMKDKLGLSCAKLRSNLTNQPDGESLLSLTRVSPTDLAMGGTSPPPSPPTMGNPANIQTLLQIGIVLQLKIIEDIFYLQRKIVFQLEKWGLSSNIKHDVSFKYEKLWSSSNLKN
jgi:hypothetical protein